MLNSQSMLKLISPISNTSTITILHTTDTSQTYKNEGSMNMLKGPWNRYHTWA